MTTGTKQKKLTPTEEELAATKVGLAEAEAKLAEMKEAVRPAEEAARADYLAAEKAWHDAVRARDGAIAALLIAARVRDVDTSGPSTYQFYHPDLVHALEKKLGVTWETRKQIAPGNSHWADPFVETLKAIYDRAEVAARKRSEVVALAGVAEALSDKRYEAANEVRKIEATYTGQRYAVERLQRNVRDLIDKIREYARRSDERKWKRAADAEEKAEDPTAVDPSEARATAKAIAAGTEKLEW